jgi:hypothetical protein
MPSVVILKSDNFSGDVANITFYPLTGGSINIGPQIIPYVYVTDYYEGTYNLNFTAQSQSCEVFVSPSGLTELVFGLGRGISIDNRDKNYLIKDKITINKSPIISRYWEQNEWWGNQGITPQCVGYSWAHWIEDGPVKHGGTPPIVHPTLIYKESQKIDEWPGENYDGTSVRAGAKYLQQTKRIKNYYWAFDINTLINTVLNVGPVVAGTYWYRNMFYPDRNGNIRIGGPIVGGHAYVINGIDTRKRLFRIKNSWGRGWGLQGNAYISFTDMERLIKMNGEICLATENNF